MANLLEGKRVHIYCRVSSKNQSGYGHVSLETQENEIRKNIPKSAHVISVVRETSSAFRSRQPKLKILIDNAYAGDVIVAYQYDRISRNIFKFIQDFWPMVEAKNIRFVSVNELCDMYKPAGRHQIVNLVNTAHYQSELTGQRVRDAYAYRASMGTLIRPAKFGKQHVYIDGKKTAKFKVNPREQIIIELIAAMRDGTMTMSKLNELMYTILPDDPDWRVPIEITGADGLLKPDDKPSPDALSFSNIAAILNIYELRYRTRNWSAETVKKVYRSHPGSEMDPDVLVDMLSSVHMETKTESPPANPKPTVSRDERMQQRLKRRVIPPNADNNDNDANPPAKKKRSDNYTPPPAPRLGPVPAPPPRGDNIAEMDLEREFQS